MKHVVGKTFVLKDPNVPYKSQIKIIRKTMIESGRCPVPGFEFSAPAIVEGKKILVGGSITATDLQSFYEPDAR